VRFDKAMGHYFINFDYIDHPHVASLNWHTLWMGKSVQSRQIALRNSKIAGMGLIVNSHGDQHSTQVAL